MIDGAGSSDPAADLHAGGGPGDRHRVAVRLHHLVERVPRHAGDDDGGAKFTLPLILANARTATSLGGTDWAMLQAGITISIIPCVLIYLLLQRYFVSGLLTGAVK